MLLTSLAVLLRIVSNPLANVFQKKLTQSGNNPLLVNFLTYFLLSVICIISLLGVNLKQLPADFWLYSVLAGFVGALGNFFLIKALQSGDLSVLGPINSYKSVVGIIVGIFLLNEIPSLYGLAGVALIVYGSYYVLDSTEDKFSFALFRRKEIQYRILSLVLSAIGAIFDKKIIINSTVMISFISWCWFGMFFSFCLMLVYRVKIVTEVARITLHDFSKYLLLILCVGLMQFSTNFVFSQIQVGYGLALFQISTILSVFFGYHIFKESDIVKKLIGSVIMIGGSLIIIFFN